MSIVWKIKIHKLVISEDLKSINHRDQEIILKAIQKKLSFYPKDFGKPLSEDLKGYWRIRVNNYRVIYKIKDDVVEVLVIKIGLRRNEEVYKKALHRLNKLQENYFS